MSARPAGPLSSRVVLVTRPGHQSQGFIDRVEQLGGQALAFPTLEIQPRLLDQEQLDRLHTINQYDLLIFISANAVKIAKAALESAGMDITLPGVDIAAIGRATANAASLAGFQVNIQPVSGYDSESLLEDDYFQPASIRTRRILIVKGEGGREVLYDTLKQRGAEVETLELYRRSIPVMDTGIKRQQLSENWRTLGINSVTVTSNAALQNLYDMLEEPGRDEMLETQLIVPSTRAYELARQLGFRNIQQAITAHDDDMLQALLDGADN